MPSYVTPKINTQYIFYISVVSQADTKLMQNSATIAAGDFQVSTNGGTLANLTTIPAVTPASSDMIKITLSTSEMNGDNVTVVCSDAAGSEWCDQVINIQTSATQMDDLNVGKTGYTLSQAFPTNFADMSITVTSGRVDVGAVLGTAQTANDNGADINAIKVTTDKFVFTVTNEVDANTVSINDAEVIGDGNATGWDGI